MSKRGFKNAALRAKHKPEIIQFCEDHGFKYRWMDGDWHMRVENVLDVYPTRKRWHWLPDAARGSFDDYEDLGRIFIENNERTHNEQ